MKTNIDKKVVKDFGNEWKEYNQQTLSEKELKELFDKYFKIFPFEKISKNSTGFDMGCGSGRWAKFIAPKVKKLNCIEPSKDALMIAKENLQNYDSCIFKNEDAMSNTIKNNTQDFGYCLGVLHHIPNTKLGLENCVKKLKKGAPFLIYLYYRFDNKPAWYKIIWKISNIIRLIISKVPFRIKLYITKFIALFIYWPFAKYSYLIKKLGYDVQNIPLSSYKEASFYTMCTDSLDRFGTKLEYRFTKDEIYIMMKNSGLTEIKFSEESPFWVAVGIKN